MPNLFDYVTWRSDISFDYDGFNEVDNLLFCQLSYIDFDNIVPDLESGETLSLDEVSKIYFSKHTLKETDEGNPFLNRCPHLLKAITGSNRYSHVRMGGYINEFDAKKTMQMSAIYFFLPDDSVYIAFRGTDDSVISWKEDFNFSYLSETVGQRKAVEYLDLCLEKLTQKIIRVGGHSKGGNYAVYSSAMCQLDHIDKITEIWCNDGPGMLDDFFIKSNYELIKDRIHSIIPESSLIGVLLTNPLKSMVVKSREKGVMQHDANSWQIERNRFVTSAGLSELGELNDRTIKTWLKDISPSERKRFIDSFFSIFEMKGIEKVSELDSNMLKNIFMLSQSMKGLTKEEQEHVRGVLRSLVLTFGRLEIDNVTKGVMKLNFIPKSKKRALITLKR